MRIEGVISAAFGWATASLGLLLAVVSIFSLTMDGGVVCAGFAGALALACLSIAWPNLVGKRRSKSRSDGQQPARQRPSPDKQRPTDKQIRYARKLGIKAEPLMSRAELSSLIGEAEFRNPHLAEARERTKAAARLRKYSSELIAEEEWWTAFGDSTRYMLAIYRKGKNIIVDVLSVDYADIDDDDGLYLFVAAPQLINDRFLGARLEWETEFELRRDRLLHFEPMENFDDLDSIQYQRAVKRGLKIAKKFVAS